MKSSVIAHPPDEPLIIIRQWQIEACDGNRCAAALLSFFEYWHNIRVEQVKKSRQSNDIAEMHGDSRTQDETLYQFHNERELEDGILGLYKKDAISDAINKVLIPKGFITAHRNPNPRYHFDKTRHFFFEAESVNLFLESRQPENRPSKPENRLRQEENPSRQPENPSSSPKTTTETTMDIGREGECEGEKKTQSVDCSPAPPLEISKQRERRSRSVEIDDPFMVRKEMREWAAKRAPDIDCKLETERFVNWARGGGKKKVNWIATWKNWLLRAQSEAPKRPKVVNAY